MQIEEYPVKRCDAQVLFLLTDLFAGVGGNKNGDAGNMAADAGKLAADGGKRNFNK